LPNVCEVVSNDDKPRLLSILSASSTLSTAQRFGDGDGACGAALETGMAGRTAFTLRVQTGCAESCTYCIIPSTRGAPRSVPISQVHREVERVQAAGFKEIILTGVHLGSYGRDLTPRSALSELLDGLDRQWDADNLRFRISSLEPMDCSQDIVDVVVGRRSFAPHFHLPLQHASNRVLAAMGRPYTVERYADLVTGIRRRLPDASIGSDVIVGFPGETGTEFEELALYLESSPLTHVHVFPYSDRPGTAASAMTHKVAGQVIRERGRRIRNISQRLTERFHTSQIGAVHRALTIDDGASAVTGNYLKASIPPGRSRNEWVRVRIGRGDGGTLAGEICVG
jgi:threonylcarbamoyladenosine tRNA methylthiotransferase MtaB